MKNEITRGYENYTLTLSTSNSQKSWMSTITGTDEKYGFSRQFIEECESGRGWKDYKLEDGKLYNWNQSNEQHFGTVEDGKLYEITKDDALELAK